MRGLFGVQDCLATAFAVSIHVGSAWRVRYPVCCMMVLLGEHLIPHSEGGCVLTSSDACAVPPDNIDVDFGEASGDPLCGLWSRIVDSSVLLNTMDAAYQPMAAQGQNWARKVHTLKGISLHCLSFLTCLQVNACCFNCTSTASK